MSFWESSFLWLEAVIASMAVAAACGMVGVYTVLRRVVFLPAALSQVSGLGVVLAFLLPVLFPALAGCALFEPALFALGVTLLAALLLGWMPEPRRLSREALIGIAFIAASALVILVGDRVPQESHDIENILFGNAVAVERGQMFRALGTAGAVIVVHVWLLRPFMLVSFDRETALAHGVRVRAIDAVLFLSLGLAIAVATRTIGAMPVFAFCLLPAVAALRAFEEVRAVLASAPLLGSASAFLGYWASFAWELPTGACTVVVAATIYS
jgi:ABC-type Mn2+/Zn2+ transport system permease subunit